ncbi:4-amino-4-deoxy-L-arabinose transferase and related glycosyltransferase of PMT family [Candidatus Terasakiella magnetica]|nr:4-amino-4-deoxy-L-arabinose transferase and related glycosyltransferase of PMT family [Candidatus Terasakiella magnetica]
MAFTSHTASKWKRAEPWHLVGLAVLVVGAALLHGYVAAHSLLSGDEAYYWLWSRHLQLSYYDHPAMAAWWMAASTAVFGSSELAIRLPAIVATAVVTVLLYDTTRIAFDDAKAGLWAALWVNTTILFGAAGVMATPDSPLLVFWALALWAMIRLLRSQNPAWIYVLGLSLGLGFLGKYTMALAAPGIVAVFLLFPEGRCWWRRRHFYLAVVAAAVCATPVLWWNAANDWVSFRKQLAHSFDAPAADPLKSLTTFLTTQVGVVTPLILGFCLWGMGWALWAGWRRRRADWFLLGACSAPILAFFIHHSLGGLVQAHWSGPAYLGGIMAACGGWSVTASRRGRVLAALALLAPVLGALMLGAVYLQMVTALLPLPAKIDPLSRLGGWDAVAATVGRHLDAHPGAFVSVQKHEMSGLLTYYLPGHPKVFLTGSAGAPRLPSYDRSDVAGLVGRDGLFVTKSGTNAISDLTPYFDKMVKVEDMDRLWGGRVVDHYEIWLGESYRPGTFGDQPPAEGR